MNKSICIAILLLFYWGIALCQTRKDSLYVFVGKKIELVKFEIPHKTSEIILDEGFKAKYQIIKNVYGNYNKDTIEFEVFDHYGIPAFSKYDYVLLFVGNYNGKLYNEKYLYFDVYKTKNGRWASSYKLNEYIFNKNATLKPEPIDFSDEVSYKLDLNKNNKDRIKKMFAPPYYKIVGDKAIAVWGNYVEQLFELKKGRSLKNKGYFN